jgi:hypothetical protein
VGRDGLHNRTLNKYLGKRFNERKRRIEAAEKRHKIRHKV